jgi:signal transduction histidine kinase/phage shock protein PspC (stress-responsive transcriptional regulator)
MESGSLRTLRRDVDHRIVGGVCAGLARSIGLDPLILRVAFVAAAAAGVGIPAYLVAWAVLPADGAGRAPVARLLSGRGAMEVALGVGLLVLAVMLTMRELGFWFSDAIAWPLVLIAAGGALLWRQSLGGSRAGSTLDVDEPPTATLLRGSTTSTEVTGEPTRSAPAVSRIGIGVALVIAAGVVFLQATGALSAARDVLLAVLVVVIVLGVILAPLILRLVRSLTDERARRIRSQERAEVAAHLHDSVLQTLALVQRRSHEPGEVAQLARRQERELRAWLAGRPSPSEAATLAAALEAAAAEVEGRHGVPVEVVAVGDRALDRDVEAVVAAAREAMTNAAKFGGGSSVDVYAEAQDGRLAVFVRDRGPGFDPASIPADRGGVRESIVGRMERHGGRATISSDPQTGTEVELVLEFTP